MNRQNAILLMENTDDTSEIEKIAQELQEISEQSAKIEADENITQEERLHSREAIYNRAAALNKRKREITETCNVEATIIKPNKTQ